MAKFSTDASIDGGLNKSATATAECACSAQPTTRTEAITTYKLATASLSGGDLAIADAGGGGRKLTIAEKTGVSITATGDITHIALVDGSNILDVTTVTTKSVTSGNTLTIGAWTATVGDPT